MQNKKKRGLNTKIKQYIDPCYEKGTFHLSEGKEHVSFQIGKKSTFNL